MITRSLREKLSVLWRRGL